MPRRHQCLHPSHLQCTKQAAYTLDRPDFIGALAPPKSMHLIISYGMKSPPPALALICVLLLWAALICFGETDSRLTQCSLLRGPAELWRNIQPDHQSGFQDFNLHRGDRSVRLGSVTEISAL